MCLATVYKQSDDSVIFKNVSRIDVDGSRIVLRDIMGGRESCGRKHSYGGSGKQHCKAFLRVSFRELYFKHTESTRREPLDQ